MGMISLKWGKSMNPRISTVAHILSNAGKQLTTDAFIVYGLVKKRGCFDQCLRDVLKNT
jgi:hypothetical protein